MSKKYFAAESLRALVATLPKEGAGVYGALLRKKSSPVWTLLWSDGAYDSEVRVLRHPRNPHREIVLVDGEVGSRQATPAYLVLIDEDSLEHPVAFVAPGGGFALRDVPAVDIPLYTGGGFPKTIGGASCYGGASC